MTVNEEKLEEIKENRKILSQSYHNEILIIIADELIKMNKNIEIIANDYRGIK